MVGCARLVWVLVATGALASSVGCRSKTPRDLTPENAVAGYVTAMSFVGGNGAIVLDDGQAFSVTMMLGTKVYRVSPEQRRQLVDTIDSADFFHLPERLHNNDIVDGSSTKLFAATASQQHWSTNYMDDNGDFAEVRSSVRKLAPPPEPTAKANTFEEMEKALRSYLEQHEESEKTAAVSRWLDEATLLWKQHENARSRQPPPRAKNAGRPPPLTVAELFRKAPKADDTEYFVAEVIATHACPVCPPAAQCKPCTEHALVADSPEASQNQVLVLMLAPAASLRRGTRYAFDAVWTSSPAQAASFESGAKSAELRYVEYYTAW